MSERKPGVHVVTTRRQTKDRAGVTHLLRRSYREDGKVKKETRANLTSLGSDLVNVIRAGLQGQDVGVLSELLPPVQSRPHRPGVQRPGLACRCEESHRSEPRSAARA